MRYTVVQAGGPGRKEMELYFTTVEPQDEKKNLLYDYAQSEKRLFCVLPRDSIPHENKSV